MNLGKTYLCKNTRKKRRRSTRKKRHAILIALRSVLVLFLVIIAGGMAAVAMYAKNLISEIPDVSTINISPTGFQTTVLDANGSQIETLAASGANRVYVTLDEIPDDLQNAFIAIEDERFYTHNGVDLKGIIRAVATTLSGGRMQGASTITQQLLKNNYFTTWVNEDTLRSSIDRKIQEQYLAIQLEKVTDKETILENYLNTINLGQNTLGVESASERYFNKPASELTLSEDAVIAAITQNPSKYNPISHPKQNAKRREAVLSKMLSLGMITESEYKEAENDDVYDRIAITNSAVETDQMTSYFVDALTDEVVQDLIDQRGYTDTQAYQLLYAGGLTIYSTQHPDIQTIIDEEVNNPDNYATDPKTSFSYRLTINKADGSQKNYSEQTMLSYYKNENRNYSINFDSEEEAQAAIDAYRAEMMEAGDTVAGESVIFTLQPQAAMTVIDQSNGEVLAITGGRGDKVASKTLNRATSITRQPGSCFKILSTYAPALDSAGLTLASVEDDAPYAYAGENGKNVANWDKRYRGFTNFRMGITHSMNIVTIKALGQIGTGLGFQYVQDFGITTLVSGDNNQALAIGGITNGVTNLELTNAYATIANHGEYHTPIFYTQVIDHNGNVILDNTETMETGREVLKDTTAWLLTNAMQDVLTSPEGTGGSANPGNTPVAAKTGTTNDDRDTLMVGYSPYYTVGFWGGNDDNAIIRNTSFSNRVWKQVMYRLHEGLERKNFTKPEGIVQAVVCKKSGKLAIPDVCNADPRGDMSYVEYFAKGTEPSATDTCDHHIRINVCNASGYPASPLCPGDQVSSNVCIVGGSVGTEDEPYLMTEEKLNTPCPVHSGGQVQ